MIRTAALLLLLVSAPVLAQEESYDPSLDPKRYDGCVRAIPTDAQKAEEFAVQWQAKGGGLPARHCQALAQLQQGKNAAAALTLSKAAQAAEAEKSPMAADFWGQAGNAALLVGDARGAVTHFSSGIVAAGEFAPARTANLLIDRARAHTELKDLKSARTDLDKAIGLAPTEPTGWLLSAALARRQDDLARARTDIAKAAELAPADADVQFEQGAILAASGDIPGARRLWGQVVQQAPGTDAATLAARALNDAPAQ